MGNRSCRNSTGEAELKAGESKQFTVDVKGKGEFSKEVSWELVGKHHEDTYIDEKGTLYVSKAEAAGEVKVKAVLKRMQRNLTKQ